MTVIGKKIGYGEIEGTTLTTTTEGNCTGQKGDPGPQGEQGVAGPAGPAGMAGANGTKILNGTGDPDNWLTPLTVLGDYYLDNNTANLWQRETSNYDFTPTIIDLPGNVRWRRVAILKISLVDEIVIEGQDPFLLIREFDAEQEQTVDVFKVTTDVEAGNSNVYFKALKNNVLHNFLQYYAGNKFLTFDGLNGVQIPVLTLAEMNSIVGAMTAGFVAFCSDTQTLRVTTSTGWIDLMLNGARLVLGGVDNLTDRLQVTGTSKFSSFIDIAANGLKMQGSQTLLYSGGALYHYAYGGGHVFTRGAGDITLFEIKADGRLILNNTITATGTTGARTINAPSGTVNIAAGQNSLVVTNSCVSANSLVFATIRTNDSTAQIKNVVPAAGSFTIRLTANATAETSIGFFVVNF